MIVILYWAIAITVLYFLLYFYEKYQTKKNIKKAMQLTEERRKDKIIHKFEPFQVDETKVIKPFNGQSIE